MTAEVGEPGICGFACDCVGELSDFPIRACSPRFGVGVCGNSAPSRLICQQECCNSAIVKNRPRNRFRENVVETAHSR